MFGAVYESNNGAYINTQESDLQYYFERIGLTIEYHFNESNI